MAVINHAKREINAKLVYYGPPGAGKASLFSYIHQRIKPSLCGPLKSMPAGGDTLLFFDYLPFESACLDGYRVRFHLYTLTGPVDHLGTWKMTLKGVDGLALVSEPGQEHDEQLAQALRSLRSILTQHGRDLQQVPCVLISTKADQGVAQDVDWVADLSDCVALRSSVVTGEGVLQSLASLAQSVLQRLREDHGRAQALPAALEVQDDIAENACCVTEQEREEDSIREHPLLLNVEKNTNFRLPLTLQVAGQARHFALNISINLECLDDDFSGA